MFFVAADVKNIARRGLEIVRLLLSEPVGHGGGSREICRNSI